MSREQMKARLEAATPGPWEWIGSNLERCSPGYGDVLEVEVECMSYCYGGSPRMNISAGNKALLENASTDLAKLHAALDAVEALHKPVTYWMTHEDADVSYQNKEDALWCRGDLTEADLVPFELCTHCKMIEDSPCEGECTSQAGYREALWPCSTVTAIRDVLGEDPQ